MANLGDGQFGDVVWGALQVSSRSGNVQALESATRRKYMRLVHWYTLFLNVPVLCACATVDMRCAR